ncbi:hypothetical protein [Streptomyces sp. TP-A0874]|uniref:hypothetical protein n=1 Tax=Streptomyces sp. TP-A0874 TaxID=549819 RepID=UPI000852D16C|nr:hypothetical protein [Streptomyces sp. TP-A0874]
MPATVRSPRSVAVRRALLVAVFLGGLLGLALLLADGAHAAQRTEPATDSAQELFNPAEKTPQQSEQPVIEGDYDFSAPAGRGEVADAVEGVVRPILRQSEAVTRPIAEIVDGNTGGVLPLPGGGEAGGEDDSAEEGAGSQDERGGSEQAADDRDQRMVEAPTAEQARAPIQCSDSQRKQPSQKSERAEPDGDPEQEQQPGPQPVQLPEGPYSAATSVNSADGNNGPRGGESHAVLPSGQPLFGLKAGAIRAVSASPTRDRSTEILEFPG